MNNGKYHTEEYKAKQAQKVDKLYGPLENHIKECEGCGEEYIFSGRIKTKAYKNSRFCSRSCANNRQSWWNDNAIGYRTIAFQNWDKCCAICGFDKIVAVHHIDENHHNNDPNNLIPLCPNHHEMVHSKWKNEVQPIIKKLVEEKNGALV